MTRRVSFRAMVLGVLAAGLGQAPAVSASDRAWTNVGTVGVVDDANQSQVMLDVSRARLGAGVVSAMVRYNVTATEGLFQGATKKLTVRFYKPDNFTIVQA